MVICFFLVFFYWALRNGPMAVVSQWSGPYNPLDTERIGAPPPATWLLARFRNKAISRGR